MQLYNVIYILALLNRYQIPHSDAIYTVLGVKISHGHDHTSCATLGHFEMEF